MARMIVGSRGSVLAVSQTRMILADLSAEWPDVNLTQRTFQGSGEDLLEALSEGRIHLGIYDLAELPLTLPDGCELVAVTKRLEPRAALLSKGHSVTTLSEIDSSVVGVRTERDGAFIRAGKADLTTKLLQGTLDDHLARLASEELSALVLPCSYLIQLERRRHTDVLLEPDLFTPAAGQGCIGIVARENDDLAFELAYSLQHRPSFDRVRAERVFAEALAGEADVAVGALASVTSDGDLNLLGAVADPEKGLLIQAETSGEAGEAVSLGRELAKDMLEQMTKAG